jgi:FkbM family methyltransferase
VGVRAEHRNFRCAEITLKINGLTNVMLANAALGSGPGVGTVLTTDAHGRAKGGASRVVNASNIPAGSGVQPVPLVTVDDVVPHDGNVSVIQLDVEGYEQAALSGAVGTIARCRPLLHRPGRRLVGHASSSARLQRGGHSAPQRGPGLYRLRRAISLTGAAVRTDRKARSGRATPPRGRPWNAYDDVTEFGTATQCSREDTT